MSRRETARSDSNSVHFSGERRGWLEVEARRLCTKCKQRKPIEKGCKTKPSFICKDCPK